MEAVDHLKLDVDSAEIEFVTFRNNLNKIMAAPYFHSRSEYDAFAIDIYKKNNVIFLEIVDRSELMEQENQQSVTSEKPSDSNGVNPEWWGRRFEQLIRVSVFVSCDESPQFVCISLSV